MYLGIDLGTSGVKAVIVDDGGMVVAQATALLDVSRPQPLWSEQNPADWWTATEDAIGKLDADLRRKVRGIGLSGQMHGAVVLDKADRVLRPAILWNDGRAGPGRNALRFWNANRMPARSPAMQSSPGSPPPSCCGWPSTNPMSSPPRKASCCPRTGCG